MSWNIADYYLLDKIKKAEAQIAFLLYRIGNIQTVINAGGAGILTGTEDPNVAGRTPIQPLLPALYQQYAADGTTPLTLWWWHPGSQTWV